MKQILLIILSTVAALTAYACKCRTLLFFEEVTQADQIFTGTVIRKDPKYKTYYLFSVSQMFKGSATDTITIETGMGGPDCGMNFEVGKTYVVYASNKQTSSCRRNAMATNNPDMNKLKYFFNSSFSGNIGKTTDPTLTKQEAEYLNSELMKERKAFNLQGKKVAFASKSSIITKEEYFNNWGGRDVANDLIILTNEERQKANGYDAIIVSWRKQGVSNGFRKRLIKKLA